jgi:hypothetical protein
MVQVGALPKEVLVDEREVLDSGVLTCFFEELALKGLRGGFGELDVAAWKI